MAPHCTQGHGHTLASGPGIAVSRGHHTILSCHCLDVMMSGGLFYSKYFEFVVMHLYFPVAVTRVEIVTQEEMVNICRSRDVMEQHDATTLYIVILIITLRLGQSVSLA